MLPVFKKSVCKVKCRSLCRGNGNESRNNWVDSLVIGTDILGLLLIGQVNTHASREEIFVPIFLRWEFGLCRWGRNLAYSLEMEFYLKTRVGF